ncbi:MAG: hypothetical protein ACI3X6_05350 [Alloprevotella sp.]
MSVKIISRLVKICPFIVFTMCLKVEISSVCVEFFSGLVSASLIIPKSLRRAALTIANAVFTLYAGSEAALTSFGYYFTCIGLASVRK